MPVAAHRNSVAMLTAIAVTAGENVSVSHVQWTGQSAHGPVVSPVPEGVACGVGLMTGTASLLGCGELGCRDDHCLRRVGQVSCRTRSDNPRDQRPIQIGRAHV